MEIVNNIEKKVLKLSEIRPNSYNPNKMDEVFLEALKKQIKENGYLQPILVNNRKKFYEVVDGEHRLIALKELGYEEAECWIMQISQKDAKKLTLQMGLHGEYDYEGLNILMREMVIHDKSLGFDEIELEFPHIDIELIEIPSLSNDSNDGESEGEELGDVGDIENENLAIEKKDYKLAEVLEDIDKLIVFYSGGRDSTLATYSMMKWVDCSKIELVYVDTGVEIPDTIAYVFEFAEHFKLKLTIVKPELNFIQHYLENEELPHFIYKDCIEKFINKPIRDYYTSLDEKILLIRGGRKGQVLQRKGKSTDWNELDHDGEKYLSHQPLFYLTDEELQKLEDEFKKEFHLWTGYERGYARTACFCCPFQGKKNQIDTLKKEYPFLWEFAKNWMIKCGIRDKAKKYSAKSYPTAKWF